MEREDGGQHPTHSSLAWPCCGEVTATRGCSTMTHQWLHCPLMQGGAWQPTSYLGKLVGVPQPRIRDAIVQRQLQPLLTLLQLQQGSAPRLSAGLQAACGPISAKPRRAHRFCCPLAAGIQLVGPELLPRFLADVVGLLGG